MGVHRYPRFRALRRLLLDVWDKAVGTDGYVRREWEELQTGITELAEKGLGLPEFMGPEEPTPVDRPLRFIMVVEASKDGQIWTESLRAPLGHVLECEDVCRDGDRYFRIYVAEAKRLKNGV